MKHPKCAITNKKDVIDDCYIKLEFGYGSKRDMETYSFGPVRDKTGEKDITIYWNSFKEE